MFTLVVLSGNTNQLKHTGTPLQTLWYSPENNCSGDVVRILGLTIKQRDCKDPLNRRIINPRPHRTNPMHRQHLFMEIVLLLGSFENERIWNEASTRSLFDHTCRTLQKIGNKVTNPQIWHHSQLNWGEQLNNLWHYGNGKTRCDPLCLLLVTTEYPSSLTWTYMGGLWILIKLKWLF